MPLMSARSLEAIPIHDVLQQADKLRRRERWESAASLYRLAERTANPLSPVKHNLALCLLSLGDMQGALAYAEAALALEPALWQSEIVRAKALQSLGRTEEALVALEDLLMRQPENGEARLELASLLLHDLGDAFNAHRRAASLRSNPRHAQDATLASLMARLYDRDESSEALTAEIIDFAALNLFLAPTGPTGAPARPRVLSRRRRVGLISPLLCCSPVYFFCIGSLKLLSQDFDLVFIHRGFKHDWATDEFRAIASDWLDAAALNPEDLAQLLRRQGLDVLLDLGGWMDTGGLRALSTKPAQRMYKWVGGQAATTGLRSFDGMLTDLFQTPHTLAPLYTEPLVLLRQGYVTYTAPGYLPTSAPAGGPALALGVISNPAKVSRAFLGTLASRLQRPQAREISERVTLRFIDRRYRHAPARQRIEVALGSLLERVRVEFAAPVNHPDYLSQVAKLDVVLDTFPYTGGLTTIEALSLGVPCRTRSGRLFSERHSHAHCRYAGLALEQFDFDGWELHSLLGRAGEPRASLIRPGSNRVDHVGLADELAGVFCRPNT